MLVGQNCDEIDDFPLESRRHKDLAYELKLIVPIDQR